MNPTDARRWLWEQGWTTTVADLLAAFPDRLPEPAALRDWAARTLAYPVLPPRLPRPPRDCGLSIADARAMLQAAGYQVDGNRIARAMRFGEVRLTRDRRLLDSELRAWAKRNLSLADGASP